MKSNSVSDVEDYQKKNQINSKNENKILDPINAIFKLRKCI